MAQRGVPKVAASGRWQHLSILGELRYPHSLRGCQLLPPGGFWGLPPGSEQSRFAYGDHHPRGKVGLLEEKKAGDLATAAPGVATSPCFLE